jgi:hypothetical protein
MRWLIGVCWAGFVVAQDAQPEEAEDKSYRVKILPYVVYSETLGGGIGIGFVGHNAIVDDANFFLSGLTTNNGSFTYLLNFRNLYIPVPYLERLLLSFDLYHSYYAQSWYHIDGNPDFVGEPAGSNDSDFLNRVQAQNNFWKHRLELKFLWPWADGAGGYSGAVKRESAGQGWLPWRNGATYVSVLGFWESFEMSIDAIEQPKLVTSGLKFLLDWDNRNSENNASSGGRTRVNYQVDFGDDYPGYTFWSVRQSFNTTLFGTPFTTQQVLSLRMSVMDTPSWDQVNADGEFQRPPFFAGATLGGYDDLRGYGNYRFHDRSAVSYNIEYRVLPAWQPMQSWPILEYYDVPWWQWVIFYDLARVDNGLDLETFTQDLHDSYGLGARFQIEGVLVRMAYAQSQEDSQFIIMVNQPF